MPEITDYFRALERLQERKAVITADAVAIEAGAGKGAIKRKRPRFKELLKAIDAAKAERAMPAKNRRDKLAKTQEQLRDCQRRLEESLARELSLIMNVFRLKQELSEITGANVITLKSRSSAASR
jgi:hypothetical protein